MRHATSQLIRNTSIAAAARFAATSGAKKYDLFGYEVDTNTAPWIEKIKKCKYYDEAGEVLVNMNVSNCPPDIATYNAALQRIYEAPSKQAEPVENESKFCAMLDLMEEMSHRNKMKPNEESWMWVMRECVKSGQFRLGYCIQRVMEAEFKSCPADLVKQNEANAEKAKAEGKEHPGYLSKQVGLFDVKIE
ncbi:ribonucleoprotein p18, mitochondrial precursor [Trypanosoma rangeli SC58]|nr:ribonucleoprotein p18, mitochondrial precursor [Trypanosoma rangeli SC58]